MKWSVRSLDYRSRGTPLEKLNTHSLRAGGAMALHRNGYTDHDIMKMGRWRSNNVLKYICEHIEKFTAGMSTAMSKRFHFDSVHGCTLHDATTKIKNTPDPPQIHETV